MGATFNPFTGTLDFTGTGGGGGGTPAAPDTSVQFNDGGSFGGDAGLTWDKTSGTLGIQDDSFSTAHITVIGINTDLNLLGGPGDALNGGGSATLLGGDGTPFGGDARLQGGAGVDGGNIRLTPGAASGGDEGAIFLNESSGGRVAAVVATGLVLSDGKALQTDTATAHTALLQAYDVDGAAYATFAILLNDNTPRFTVSQPAGGLLVVLPPTADPHVAGALWNNSGLAVISSG